MIGDTLFRPVRFPRPSGGFSVGTTTRQWVDHERVEILAEAPGEQRELSVQIWYPTNSPRGPRSIYLADAPIVFASLLDALRDVSSGRTCLPPFLFCKLARSRTNAIVDAPVIPNKRCPVIVSLSGFGGFRNANTILIEELVSHGYVVIGVDQPYVSARTRLGGGRLVTMKQRGHLYDNGEEEVTAHLASDVSFLIDEIRRDPAFAHSVTTARSGVMGVSLGGTVVAAAARVDPRIAACLMMDAVMPADIAAHGLPCAALWLTRPAEDMRLERRNAGGWPEETIERTLTSMEEALSQQSAGTGQLVRLPGMFHIDFTDAPHWFPWARWIGLSGRLGPRRARDVLGQHARTFFGRAVHHPS